MAHARLRIGVVHDQPLGMLRQARRLLVSGFVEAFLIDLDAEAAGCCFGAFFQGFWIGLGGDSDFSKVGIEAHSVPAGRLQVLAGADKDAGTSSDGIAQCAEVATRFGSQEHDGLLRLLGHHDENTFFACLAVPRFHACEPLVGRRIGDAAQEGDDEDIARGLTIGKVGMDPKPVSREEVGHLANGQSYLAPLDVYVHFGAGKVKRLGMQLERGEGKQ